MAPVLLLGIGAMQTAYNASNSTILQMVVPDHLRSRVLSALYVNKGLVQLGTAFLATLAAWLGVRYALASTASVIVLFFSASGWLPQFDALSREFFALLHRHLVNP